MLLRMWVGSLLEETPRRPRFAAAFDAESCWAGWGNWQWLLLGRWPLVDALPPCLGQSRPPESDWHVVVAFELVALRVTFPQTGLCIGGTLVRAVKRGKSPVLRRHESRVYAVCPAR